nr:unnamed protein product [Callosobruchus chinensis]
MMNSMNINMMHPQQQPNAQQLQQQQQQLQQQQQMQQQQQQQQHSNNNNNSSSSNSNNNNSHPWITFPKLNHLLVLCENHYRYVGYKPYKTSIKCLSQQESSNRYLNLPVAPTKTESIGLNDNTLTYPQFLATAGAQVAYTKEIHDTLVAAAQNISPSD